MVLRRLRRKPEEPQADEQKIQQSLSKTRHGFFGRIGGLFGRGDISEETWEELEELLILADVGVNTALPLV